MRKHSVVIVGGGIGGATAAFFMKQAGLDVLMVERDQFPRDKVCGDGQVAQIHHLIKAMGILEEVDKWAYKCSGTTISDDREKIVDFKRQDDEYHYCTPRYIFDDIVNKAAVRTGIDYMEGFDALEILQRRGKAYGVRGMYNGKLMDVEADLVVIANGAHSMLSRQMGFYEEDPEYVFYGIRGYFEDIEGMPGGIEFHYPHEMFSPAGYIWLFPMGEKRANVGVFITEASLKKTGMTPEEILWWWRDNTKIGHERLSNAKCVGEIKGWRLPTCMHQEIIADGVIAVGDAANMIEPLYGGGVPHAMTAGVFAAQAAAKAVAANDFSKEFLQCYKDMVEEELRPGYLIQDYLRKSVFTDWNDLHEFLDYSEENYINKGINMDAGDVMAQFVVERRGYQGSTKSAYSK